MMDRLIVGGDGTVQAVQLTRMSNRHGLITGATGTGKTVTLQVIAEAFSRAGVPVFAADVKGDLSGISAAGKPHREVERRKGLAGITEHNQRAYPTLFWDIFGERGHPVRTTISDMGPHILSTLLELNETQSGVLYACFALADDEGMLLLDLKDLRSLLAFMSDNADDLRKTYGNISPASVGAIQRRLLVLEEQGADRFFGEPALDLKDLMRKDFSGLGIISLLDSDRLLRDSPRLYAAFLLWLLSELFEELPEAGDLDRPKIVLFFDEAHLLFDGMPKSLLDKIEQVVRLIRSKGVGVYLVTQNPTDVPQTVLGQLGLKVQHALRAFTPADQQALKGVVAGFRNDHDLDLPKIVTSLGVGEAVVSALDEQGTPTSAVAISIAPPESRIGPLTAEERAQKLADSPLSGRYDQTVDRESAYEILLKRAEGAERQRVEEETRAREEKESTAREKQAEAERKAREKEEAARQRREEQEARRDDRSRSRRQSAGEAFLKSAASSIGRSLGNKIVRGILGSILK
jgi:DNA helicase HerA-like ATPase